MNILLGVMALSASLVLTGCLTTGRLGNCEAVSSQLGSEQAASPSAPLREKLDATLFGLVESYEDGGSGSAATYARSSGLDFREQRVPVRVLAASEQGIGCLEQWIREAGGSVESRFENSVFASMPVGVLRAFAASEAVWRVDVQQSLLAPPSPAEPGNELPPNPQEDRE